MSDPEESTATATATSDEITSESSRPASTANNINNNSNGFFPWLDDNRHQGLTSRVLKRFPLLGAVGIIGSLLTPFLSWLTLFLFHNHPVESTHSHLPKPAAWLSVILSINGILVHMAVSQGIAVTWWYRASRKDTTVAELKFSFLSCTIWKAFNYVALATIFVATLPINGILLQNAITSGIKYEDVGGNSTTYGIASELPAGYSAQLNKDGTLGLYNLAWQTYMPTVINNADGFFKSSNTRNTCIGSCSATLETVGFNSTCTDSTTPYSLPYDNSTSTTFGGIASSLDAYFKSSIDFNTTENSTSVNVNGFYAQQLQPTVSYDENGNIVAAPNKCNEIYAMFGWWYNPSDYILDQIRQTLFYTSLSVAEAYTTNMTSPISVSIYSAENVQTYTNTGDYKDINVYIVLWRYWGASWCLAKTAYSVAVTIAILLFIMPTFYGFWTLARKTTLSPFETARAFHAPIMMDSPADMDTKILLKEVGETNLHSESMTTRNGEGSPV